ncbi:MAG: CDGSH iron-sulfur domain-containing protein [Defluviitaleaceae bacterium]|nr:CDGSH iron-sulfur domain-containing protein [Defluviitaleaceae bacterium]
MNIKITKNGPYAVDSDVPLKDVDSVADKRRGVLAYQEEKTYDKASSAAYLCRCGHSENKPFCDGHHAKIGFDGTETNDRKPYDDGAEFAKGAVYDVLDNQALCSAARFCDVGDGFWAAVERHDEAGKKYAEHVGCTCSSGRFTLVDKQTGKKLEPSIEKEIYLVKDVPARHLGPIHVRGEIQIIGADGFEYEVRNRVTLCRCGESDNKPFCDGTHLDCKHMEIKQ